MFFFFNDTATTEIYTLSLHDALPIYEDEEADEPIEPVITSSTNTKMQALNIMMSALRSWARAVAEGRRRDRKSTRLNSSHANISYAVFCLKKKKKIDTLR